MTFKETAHAWAAAVPPKQKLILLYVAGMDGQAIDSMGIAKIAVDLGIRSAKVERCIVRLLKAGLLRDSTFDERRLPGPGPTSLKINLPAGVEP